MHTYDVAVVGGGIIGLGIAFEAERRGLRVVVFERAKPGAGASAVAAGMLAPVTEAAFGERELLRANLESARRWPAWAAELEVELLPGGALMVARDGDEAEALERELAFRRELELPVTRLRASEARRREPALAPAVRLALDVPDDTAVDPGAVIAALLGRGLDVRAGVEVERVEPPGTVVLRGGERVRAETVVVAAGSWSGELDGIPEDARIPVRPVKGELLCLRDPGGPGLVTRLLRTEDAYLVPRGDGRYVLGATQEERGWDTSVTAGAVWELLRSGSELVPGLLEWELEAARAGLRPGTPDNAPAIGPGAVPGLVWATGHFRNGILLAPLTAQLVAGLLAGEEPDVPLALQPGRFAGVAA
jgi:glycine oxidase